jgi:hypothetical protein
LQEFLLLRKEGKMRNREISDNAARPSEETRKDSRDPFLIVYVEGAESVTQSRNILPEEPDAINGKAGERYVEIGHFQQVHLPGPA